MSGCFFVALGVWLWFGGYDLILGMMGLAVTDVDALGKISADDIGGQDFSGIRNLLLGLAALLGVPFFILNAWIKERQTRTAEQGHMTDRIAKAVEALGTEKSVKRHTGAGAGEARRIEEVTEPNLEVRIGAIYALERISQDSSRDHWQVMEILTAYLRENAKAWPEGKPDTEEDMLPWLHTMPSLRVDLQAVFSVLARRKELRRLEERMQKRQLNLRELKLVNPDFIDANFLRDLSLADMTWTETLGANLRGANLANLKIKEVNLSWADLREANLRRADLFGATLRGANFIDADLRQANLQLAYVARSKFRGANLEGANLEDVDFSVVGRPIAIVGLSRSRNLNKAVLPDGWSVTRNLKENSWDIMTPDGPYID